MHLKLIACEVLCREVCLCIAQTKNTVDVEFTCKNAHEASDYMRADLQQKIDQIEDGKYDAILLGYGLCGNATVGLIARNTPLVIPRAHDCRTLFLGSRLSYQEYFSDNPSRPFTSVGYMERGDGYVHTSDLKRSLGLDRSYQEYVELYGEDNAQYIWETLNPTLKLETHEDKVVFIDMPNTRHLGISEVFEQKAKREGKEFIRLDGNIRLIRNLIDGSWDQKEFQKVLPGQMIDGVYDWEQILKATYGEETL